MHGLSHFTLGPRPVSGKHCIRDLQLIVGTISECCAISCVMGIG
jgi:hypothetical protein